VFQRHAGFFRQRLDPLFVAGELRRDRGVFKLQVLERSRELLARGNETIEIFFERSEPLFNAANVFLGRNMSNGTQSGPRIGMQKGPLCGVGSGLSR
jgi:hypothetical protein